MMFLSYTTQKTLKGGFQMENKEQTEKIRFFSKVVYNLLRVAFIAFIAVGVVQFFAWLMSALALHTDTILINGKNIDVSLLMKIGEFKLYMPVFMMNDAGFDASGLGLLHFTFGDALRTGFIINALSYAKKVFRALRDNASPFREDVLRQFKHLAVALLLLGVVTGVVGFLAAGIVWVLCLIFEYGCILQNESDTML
jgi:hypothetical protein